MQIKLLEDVNGAPKDSLVEVDQITGEKLISENKATEYTDDIKKIERDYAIKNITINVKESKMENKSFDLVDCIKGIKTNGGSFTINQKASGQNETTAADGGNLVYQGVTDIYGAIMDGAVIQPKCRQVTNFGPNEYGKLVTLRDISTLSTTSVPRTYNAGEAAATTATKIAFGRVDVKLATLSALVYLSEELLQDAGYVRDEVISQVSGKFGWMSDQKILNATYSAGTEGCVGLTGATGYWVAPVAHNATLTAAIVNNIIAGVDPQFLDGAEWYMSNSTWLNVMTKLGSGTTTSTQPIVSVDGKMLAGYPVNKISSMAAYGTSNDIWFGNFNKGYAWLQKGGLVVQESKEYAFNTGETVLRFTLRYGGCPVVPEWTPTDAIAVAAFSTTSGK